MLPQKKVQFICYCIKVKLGISYSEPIEWWCLRTRQAIYGTCNVTVRRVRATIVAVEKQ